MTQPPYPHQQPPYPPYPDHFQYYQPTEDPLAPARRASMLMYVIGVLMLLGGFCFIGIGAALPSMLQQHPELEQQLSAMGKFPIGVIRTGIIALGAISLLLAIALVVLARFVGGGSFGATITAIVLSALVVIYFLVSTVVGIAVGGPQNVGGVCVMLVPTVLFSLLLVWLIQAARNTSRVAQMRQQHAHQYWQYYQQQQAYGQGPYTPPPPPPPQPQPIPPSSQNPPPGT
jgi:hypothetical protein